MMRENEHKEGVCRIGVATALALMENDCNRFGYLPIRIPGHGADPGLPAELSENPTQDKKSRSGWT